MIHLQGKKFVLELRTPNARKPYYYILMPDQDTLSEWLRVISAVIMQLSVRLHHPNAYTEEMLLVMC